MSINIFCINKLLFLPYANLLLSSAVAVALVLGVAGCSSDEAGDSSIIKLDGRNATTYDEDTGDTLVSNTSTTAFRRGYKTVKGTNWKGACYVMSIDTTNQTGNGGVIGVTFDGYDDDNGNNMYVLGMRYRNSETQIYLSYFEGVSDDQLDNAEASGSFGTQEYQLINGGSSKAYATLSGVTKDSNGLVTITVIVYQNYDTTNKYYTGKYGIAIYAGDKSEDFADVDVEAISQAKDSATLPSGNISLSMASAVYHADSSDTAKLFTAYSSDSSIGTASDTLDSFGVMKNSKGADLDGKTAAQGKFGFYVNVYSATNETTASSVDGAWTCLDADLEAEVVEE